MNRDNSKIKRRQKSLCVPAWRYELASLLLSGHTIRQKLSDADLGFLAGTLDDLGISRDQLCIFLACSSGPSSPDRSSRKRAGTRGNDRRARADH